MVKQLSTVGKHCGYMLKQFIQVMELHILAFISFLRFFFVLSTCKINDFRPSCQLKDTHPGIFSVGNYELDVELVDFFYKN